MAGAQRPSRRIPVLLALASAGLGVPSARLHAGEFVVFSSGFQMEIERHEELGETVKLFTKSGVIEVAAGRIREFVPDDAPPAVPPASPAATSSPAPQSSPAPMAPTPAVPVPDPKRLLDEAAERYGVPAAFLHSVARTESAYRVNAVSHKGAIGIMQLMPSTAAELGADPHNPAENIDAGARHLRDLLERYDGSAHKALSAYNAGAGAVQRYGGVPPYRETVNYVDRVLRTYQSLSAKSK